MAKDFSKRVKSTQRSAGNTAGWMNDFVHITGVQTNYVVTPAGGYLLVSVIINTAPASGAIILTVGSDILAEISSSASATFEHKYNVYLYDRLLVSTPDAATDVTFIISKG